MLAGALWVGARPAGPLPPLGPLLDPANGVWAAASRADLPRDASGRVRGLAATTRVVFDDRAVPHIFAASEEDAVRALGYVVARDRLFQLELQTRATAGTLTELVGPAALEADADARGIGLAWAAERRMRWLDSVPESSRILRAYAEGVNAWQDQMTAADVPLEYRLLGKRPMRWEARHSAYLFSRMGYTLAYGADELRRPQIEALVGRAAAAVLFPRNSPIQEPIQPNGQTRPRVDLPVLPPPAPADTVALRALRGGASRVAEGPRRAPGVTDDGAIGSNNWAVAPARAAGAHAILAGDPHLDLSLPSIWYEAHLVVPGELDVYGVTIPGSPTIVIGFNRDIAWTFTNTTSDVLDFDAEAVDVDAAPTKYQVDGAWRPLERRVERYLGPGGALLRTDTVYSTHRGPMQRQGGRWLSMRWTLYDRSDEVESLRRVMRARTVEEFLRATDAWGVPAQNMLVADRAGTIAIRSTGKFPLRPGGGAGDTIQDGRRSANDWTGWLPLERYPQSVAPGQGFLASANQQPLDPRVDPVYMGADWPSPWRAMHINRLLRADSAVTPDAMRRFQTDPGSARADYFVPALLGAADRVLAAGADGGLREARTLLGEWAREYRADDRRALLFEHIMAELGGRVWDELEAPAGRDSSQRVATPQDQILAMLLSDSTSIWWDDRRTRDVREGRDSIVAAAMRAGLANARKQFGEPGGWRWSDFRSANVWHSLRMRPFSALRLPVQGGPSTLSPLAGRGTHGASWRMVVEMGPEVRAMATYPGGQSGNPASPRYRDRLPGWVAGRLDTLRVPRTPAELSGRTSATLTLEPRR